MLSIEISEHESYSQLVHLKYSRDYTPWISHVGAECSGMILDSSRDYDVCYEPLTSLITTGSILSTEEVGFP